jgi:hypothetical protein
MVIVQLDCPALNTAPVTVRVVDVPEVVATAVPPQLLTTLETSKPPGKLSVKDMADCAGLPAVFVIVNVSVLTPPGATDVGLNALVSLGTATEAHCCAPTADATVNDEFSPEVSTPLTPETLLVLFWYVAQVEVTPCNVMVHEPVGVASDAPLTTRTLPVKVTVPPQLLLAGPVYVTPLGKVSVKEIPVLVPPEPWMVKVSVVGEPGNTVAGEQ